MDLFDILAESNGSGVGPICLMGVNGAGKTRYLRDLAQRLRLSGRSVVYVAAERDFVSIGNQIYGVEPLMHDNFRIVEIAASPAGGAPQREIAVIISDSIARTKANDDAKERLFIEEVADWLRRGETPPKPVAPIPQLDRVLEGLGAVLGYPISALYREPYSRTSSPWTLSIKVGDDNVEPSGLSSGERQVLLIAAMMLEEPLEPMVLLIDEPELHLNEAKAIELWESMERRLTNVTFVYATHSVNFATRTEVQELYVVEPRSSPSKLDTTGAMPVGVVKDLVGARIQFRKSDRIPVLCEDEGHSMLLTDLLPVGRFEPLLANSRDSVIRAISSRAEYEQVFVDHPILLGLVDRDFASDQEIAAIESNGVFSLPYNDFEACLLHPNAGLEIVKVAKPSITYDDYVGILCAAAHQAIPETLRKLKAAVEADHAPTITYQIDSGNIIASVTTPAGALADFEQRARLLYQMVETKDVEGILRHFKGKKVYQRFRELMRAQKVEIPQPYQLYRTVREIPRLLNILRTTPGLTELEGKIRARQLI